MTDRSAPDPASVVFDCHFHVIDPAFPLVPNDGYLPPFFPVGEYLAEMSALGLGVAGGVVVTASFQGTDTAYLRAALSSLGPSWRAVIPFDPAIGDGDIATLNALGVRAMRLNIRRGGAFDIAELDRTARRIWDQAGWHMEFYLGAEALENLRPALMQLPKVAIDHLGLSDRAVPHLLVLAARGTGIKATGFARFDGDPLRALRRLHSENPTTLMFGSDLPSTRAPRRFGSTDLLIIGEAFGASDRQGPMEVNGARFYGVQLGDRP